MLHKCYEKETRRILILTGCVHDLEIGLRYLQTPSAKESNIKYIKDLTLLTVSNVEIQNGKEMNLK